MIAIADIMMIVIIRTIETTIGTDRPATMIRVTMIIVAMATITEILMLAPVVDHTEAINIKVVFEIFLAQMLDFYFDFIFRSQL